MGLQCGKGVAATDKTTLWVRRVFQFRFAGTFPHPPLLKRRVLENEVEYETAPGSVLAFLSAIILGLSPALVRADGFIVIHQPPTPVPVPPGHFSFAPLEVSFHHVSVEIKDQVAVTSVDEEFVNPNHQQLEETYLFPLPQGAHIDKFSMDINGKMQEAELLPADKARAIYEDIVRRSKDPALLEYVGRDTFKVRIFPIESHGKKRVKIQYTQLLKSDTGLEHPDAAQWLSLGTEVDVVLDDTLVVVR